MLEITSIDNWFYNYYYHHYYSTLLRGFNTSISRWFLAGVWVTASLLKSPGLFSVFWLILIIVVWMVTIHPLISKSSSPCTNSLVTVPSAPITIGIIVTFMFHRFFSSLARSSYSSLFLLSFSIILWSARMAKSTICQVLFFFFVDYHKVWSSGQD